MKGSPLNLKPLTSLRFFAAMMIVALHAKAFMGWAWMASAPASLVQGVSFFFVLSGFILTLVYGEADAFEPKAFFVARLARIYPAHLAAMVLLLVVVPWWLILTPAGDPGLAAIAFIQKITLTDALNPLPKVFLSWTSVSWSLSTELCFYLCFPFLLRNLEATWGRKLLASAVLAALCFTIPRLAGIQEDSPDGSLSVIEMNYANPLARLFEFTLGMASCIVWKQHVRTVRLSMVGWTLVETLCVVAIIGAIGWGATPALAILPAGLHAWFATSGLCFLFAAMIVVFATGGGWLARALSARFMVYLGEVSFSIYLVHQIVMEALLARDSAWLHSAPVYLGILFAAAFLLHERVEKPARSWLIGAFRRRTFSRPQTGATSGES